jgi:deoxyribodipyrimidine photolyase
MPFISVTRLRVRSVFNLLKFILTNEASVKQLYKTKGFLGGKELIDKHLTFWTLTMWTDDTSMREFRNSLPHRKAMQKLPFWCCEASYFHWTQEETLLPSWDAASQKLFQQGKLTKVRKPSANQLKHSFPLIKWKKLERVFNSR